MRTTVNLPDDLYRSVRIRAASEGRTVTSVLEEALRRLLSEEPPGAADQFKIRPLPSVGRADLPIDDNSAMRDLMDSD